MAKWNYEISEKTARSLRNAIRDDDFLAVCVALQQAYQEINELYPEYYDEYDLQNDLEALDHLDIDDVVFGFRIYNQKNGEVK